MTNIRAVGKRAADWLLEFSQGKTFMKLNLIALAVLASRVAARINCRTCTEALSTLEVH